MTVCIYAEKTRARLEFQISTAIFFIGMSFKQNNACSNPSETIRCGVEGNLVLRLSAGCYCYMKLQQENKTQQSLMNCSLMVWSSSWAFCSARELLWIYNLTKVGIRFFFSACDDVNMYFAVCMFFFYCCYNCV